MTLNLVRGKLGTAEAMLRGGEGLQEVKAYFQRNVTPVFFKLNPSAPGYGDLERRVSNLGLVLEVNTTRPSLLSKALKYLANNKLEVATFVALNAIAIGAGVKYEMNSLYYLGLTGANLVLGVGSLLLNSKPRLLSQSELQRKLAELPREEFEDENDPITMEPILKGYAIDFLGQKLDVRSLVLGVLSATGQPKDPYTSVPLGKPEIGQICAFFNIPTWEFRNLWEEAKSLGSERAEQIARMRGALSEQQQFELLTGEGIGSGDQTIEWARDFRIIQFLGLIQTHSPGYHAQLKNILQPKK